MPIPRQDPNTFQITGFMPSGGEVGPPKRSFGLGETELNLTANIDPYFRGVAIAALTPENEVEVEEAYFQTLALPQGFTLKGGRFFSGIGYQNEIHQHAWDFQDAPLPYKAFLGGRAAAGRRAAALARADAALPRARRRALAAATSFPAPIATRTASAAAARVRASRRRHRRELRVARGVSYLQDFGAEPRLRRRRFARRPGDQQLHGQGELWVADAVLKWAPNGNATLHATSSCRANISACDRTAP